MVGRAQTQINFKCALLVWQLGTQYSGKVLKFCGATQAQRWLELPLSLEGYYTVQVGDDRIYALD